MNRWLVAACSLLLAAAPAAASAPDTLSLEAAEALAVSGARPERLAAAAAIDGVRADSLAAVAAPGIEWSLHHARAGSPDRFPSADARSWELEVARSFDPWGRRSLAAVPAGFDREAASRAAEAVALGLRLEARAAHRAARFAERRRARMEVFAIAERELADRVASRVAEGVMTPLDGRLAALDRARAEARLAEAAAAAVQSRLELARALGIDDAAWARRVVLTGDDHIDTLALARDPVAAADRRLERAEARARSSAAAARERWAALAGRPETALALGVSMESSVSDADDFLGDPGGLTGLRSEDRGLSLRLSATLPGAAAARAERAAATASRVRAEAEEAALTRSLRAEAVAAGEGFGLASRAALEWRGIGERAEADLVRVRAAYADGRLGYTDYLALRQQLSDAVRESLELEARHWEALAALERAWGMTVESVGEVR